MKQLHVDDLFKQLIRDNIAQIRHPAYKTVSVLSQLDVTAAIPQVYDEKVFYETAIWTASTFNILKYLYVDYCILY